MANLSDKISAASNLALSTDLLLKTASTSGASQTVNFDAADIHECTITGDTTLTFSTTDTVAKCSVIFKNKTILHQQQRSLV